MGCQPVAGFPGHMHAVKGDFRTGRFSQLPARRLVGSKTVYDPRIAGIALVFHFHYAIGQQLRAAFILIDLYRHQRCIFVRIGHFAVVTPVLPVVIIRTDNAFYSLNPVSLRFTIVILDCRRISGFSRWYPV